MFVLFDLDRPLGKRMKTVCCVSRYPPTKPSFTGDFMWIPLLSFRWFVPVSAA